MIRLLNPIILVCLLCFNNNVLFARQALGKRELSPSEFSVSNVSTPSAWVPARSVSSISASRSIFDNHSHQAKAASCAIKDKYCNNNNGTVGKASATDFNDSCILWDPSCSGNRTLAIDKFFDQTFQHDLLNNTCFVQAGSVNLVNGSNCDKYNPPGRMSEFQKMKNWMRSQQCVSVANGWAAKYTGGEDPDSKLAVQMDPYEYHVVSGSIPSCCDYCDTNVQNVDIYYWPEPDANTSCLSIVGGSVRPVDYGATTTVWNVGTITSTEVYWGCKSKTSADPTWTAKIRTIGSLLVKVYLSDPWSSSPCTESDVVSQGSAETYAKHATIHARDHTLIIPSSISRNESLPLTTMVSGNFTFTSPSIYANFHGIKATDQCGGVFVSSTMVAFAPGELATIAGPLGIDDGYNSWTTKSFDFNDLPCPPQSVMEANWYKPQPGEPYRPLVALPNKLKKMIPWLSHCSDELFTAYDSPRALTVATALAPHISYTDHPWAPVPSPTLDPKAGQTVGSKPSTPLPASTPTVDQPKATTNAAQNPSNEKGSDNSPRPKNDPANQGRPLLLPTLNAVGPHGDPKGNNDHQQNGNLQPSSDPIIESDPAQAIDPKKSSDSGGKSEDGADPKLHNSPTPADSSHESEQNVDPVSQGNDTEQTNEENPFNDFTEDKTKTINNQVIQPLSHGISIAGTTLTPGAPPITISGTPIHLASSALLIIGTSTLPLAIPAAPTQLITTIADQLITAAPSALTIAGTTLLSPGSAGVTVAGTLISLDTARQHQLIVGTKTIPLDSGASGKNPIVTEIGNRVITVFTDRIAIASTVLTPGASGVVVGGTRISLNTAGQVMLGSKTIPLAESAGSAGEESVSLGGFSGPAGPSGSFIHTILPNPPLSMDKANVSTAAGLGTDGKSNGNSTSTAVQVFQGSAAALLEGWNQVTVTASLAVAIAIAIYIC